jgi:hypothetical protein
MFREQDGDDEQAELFAMGLIKEPEDNGTLVLVPCKHPKLCKTHGTTRIKLRILKKKFKKSGRNLKEAKL